MLPVHLLVYATQTAITTTTCIAEYLSWTHLTVADKLNLGALYVPYLGLCERKTFFLSGGFFFSFQHSYVPVLFIVQCKC